MESVATPGPSFDHREPIPGYTLLERIGSGSYGEVWKADAPGGLTKAVKIIFGQMNGSHAERELKSLNRMKQVQHPFLLSLERIEVVDGHLVIVSELAEASLQDRFDACRSEALPGIPRDELLGYLRDAADALDFLYEKHGLQHLDIKPENLLLLSRHIKVADFGLAKHVDEVESSMIGGLTPLYAPPEMFDGRPNRHSDQYSLAIVFQYMLTGEPPFAGRTTSQLAAQHLHSKPILSALPKSDQTAVGRALSKSPERRFSCCRSFVNSLSNHRSSASATRVRRVARGTARTTESATQVPPTSVPETRNTQPLSEAIGDSTIEEAAPSAALDVTSLPSLNLPESEAVAYRPTVVLALGGTAAQVVRRLRGRLTDRFGELDAVPALQLLALDTDIDALGALTSGEDQEALRLRETMSLPLCDTRHYRSKSQSLLEWMSRRWLYNIPRSLKTEGIRPLGRLAFVDHFEGILERLRCTVATATSIESVRQSSGSTGVTFAPGPPRLFVVSCISGGTGSGAVLDLAYTLRMVVAELGMSDQELIGVLLHSTGRRAAARDLAICNAVSCLSEMNYFAGPEGFYPGEPACGIEPFRHGSAAFCQSYFVHLGDELDQEGFDQGAAAVAEYLYQSTATPASAFFDLCRREPAEPRDPLTTEGTRLRSFGVTRIRNPLADACGVAGEALARLLVKKWIGGLSAIRAEQTVKLTDTKALVAAQGFQDSNLDPQIAEMAATFAESLQLDSAQLSSLAEEVVRRELGSPPQFLQRLIDETRQRLGFDDRPSADCSAAQKVLETIDGILVGRNEASTDQNHETLQSVLDTQLQRAIESKVQALQKWLLDVVNNPQARIQGATQAAAWFRSHVESLREDVERVCSRLDDQVQELERRVTSGTADPQKAGRKAQQEDPRGDAVFVRFAELRLQHAMHRSIVFVLRSMNISLNENFDRLDAIRDQLHELARDFEETPLQTEMDTDTPALAGLHDLSVFGKKKCEIVSQFDHELETRFFGQRFRLSNLTEASSEDKSALLTAMHDLSRRCVERAVHELQLQEHFGGLANDDLTNDQTLRRYLAEVTPEKLSQWGGCKRLLISGPESLTTQIEIVKENVQRIAEHDATVVSDKESQVVLCYEAQQIALVAVLRSLIGERRDYLDIASRLHARIDVDWSEPDV